MHSAATHPCSTEVSLTMAIHIIRKGAIYYFRRRLPKILGSRYERSFLFYSLKTTRLATELLQSPLWSPMVPLTV